MNESPELWERLPEETSKNFGVFRLFLEMGPERNLVKLAEQTHRSISQLRKWSMAFKWRARAAAYDEHLAGIAVKAAEKARVEMAERQIQLGQYLQGMCRAAIRRFFDDNGRLLPGVRLSAQDCARLGEVGVKIERLARGEPTEHTQNEHMGEVKVVRFPVRAASTEEWAVRAKARAEKSPGPED